MSDCLFCKIAHGDMASKVAYEDDGVKAFDDINPKAPVHIIVIPKEHIQSIAHLEANNHAILARLIYTAKQIAAEKGLNGYKLIFNVGREAGQTIDHLHLHLIGGWDKAEGWQGRFNV